LDLAVLFEFHEYPKPLVECDGEVSGSGTVGCPVSIVQKDAERREPNRDRQA
jgi:hypothetical protein